MVLRGPSNGRIPGATSVEIPVRIRVPDDIVFVDELPHTVTSKIHKLRLRDHVLPGAAEG